MDTAKDKSYELVDAIYKGLPSAVAGLAVDAEFNDDNTITARVGPDEYVISVRRGV